MIRVVLPQHLRTLAGVDGEVSLDLQDRATQRSVLDALEAEYPVLRGTIRDHGTVVTMVATHRIVAAMRPSARTVAARLRRACP